MITFRTLCVPDFYPGGRKMRDRYDEFFSNPQAATDRHQVWNIWHVPDHYTYLRTRPEKVLGDLYDDFHQHLTEYAKTLGLRPLHAYLSLYLNGMGQAVHSDMLNGTLGYVYSLAENSGFTGGDTLVARADVFDRLEPREHRGVTAYWEVHPPRFNQLLLFDDRLAHCVSYLNGTMEPLRGRVVLHGHLL